MKKFKLPSAYTVLFLIIIIIAALTWIVPAGQYEMRLDENLGQDVPVSGTYHQVDANPQSFEEVILAPIAGFYDPDSYEANGVDVALFVLIIGGFLAVVTRTGAIDAGITKIMTVLRGREHLMIPILMILFSLGGTLYGMAEETLAFYPLLIPVLIRAGYDSVTGVAVVMLGAGIGTLGSTLNPFATAIASDAAQSSLMIGIGLRSVIYIVGLVVCILYVMRYAKKVKKNPELSLVADMRQANYDHFVGSVNVGSVDDLTLTKRIILILFLVTFGLMVWGVSMAGWWMARMSGLFLFMAIVIGVVGRLSETEFIESFVDGARDLLGVALIIGIARGIVVIMDGGMMTATVLYWSEHAMSGLSSIVFINLMYWIEIVLSFLVPSSTGLAVLTMPIMAPLADFSGVGRDLVVTAYQSASGLVNLVTPTSGVVMGGLAIGRVTYDVWLKYVWPILVAAFLIVTICISVYPLLA